MARRLRHARAKQADGQHRAGQRCIFIAPEHKLMKRMLNASPPVRPATSRALGTLHDESDSKSAVDIRTSIALRATFEAKSARRRMRLLQCMKSAQGKPGVLASVADCHSRRLARRSCSPRRGRQRTTNERLERAQASPRGMRPVANSRQTGKLPVAFTPLQALQLHDWLCVKDELASALAQEKRRRPVVGRQQTMRMIVSLASSLGHGRAQASNCPFLSHLGGQGAVLKRVYDGG